MTGEKQPLDYAPPRKDDRRMPHGCLVGVACLGLPPLILGGRWLYVFVFTDYRAHHRPVMIPLGLVTVVLGGVMIVLPMILKRRR